MFEIKSKKLENRGKGSLSGEGTFDVSMNPGNVDLIMSALSNLYSNPAKAVTRELLSNAIDASDGEKIEIEISDDSFTVKDHGCGMSSEELRENYVDYGNSSKTYDFSKVGAFGFGSKSPLALTDGYRVISSNGSETNIAEVKMTDRGLKGKISETDLLEKGTTVIVEGLSKKDIETISNEVNLICSVAEMNDFEIRDERIPSRAYEKLDLMFEKTVFIDGVKVVIKGFSDSREKIIRALEEVRLDRAYASTKMIDKIKRLVSINDIVYELGETKWSCMTVKFCVEPGEIQFPPSRETIPEKYDGLLEKMEEELENLLSSDEMFDIFEVDDHVKNFLIHSDEIKKNFKKHKALASERSSFGTYLKEENGWNLVYKGKDIRFVFVKGEVVPKDIFKVARLEEKDVKKLFSCLNWWFVPCEEKEFDSFKKLDRMKLFSRVDGEMCESIFLDSSEVKDFIGEKEKEDLSPLRVDVVIDGRKTGRIYDPVKKSFSSTFSKTEHRFYGINGEFPVSDNLVESSLFILFHMENEVAFSQLEEMGFKRINRDFWTSPVSDGDREYVELIRKSDPFGHGARDLDFLLSNERSRMAEALQAYHVKKEAPESLSECCDFSILDKVNLDVLLPYEELIGVVDKAKIPIDVEMFKKNHTEKEIKNIYKVQSIFNSVNLLMVGSKKASERILSDSLDRFGVDEVFMKRNVLQNIEAEYDFWEEISSLIVEFKNYASVLDETSFMDRSVCEEFFKKAEESLFNKIDQM